MMSEISLNCEGNAVANAQNKVLSKAQRKLLESLRANAQAGCFSNPLAVSIELDAGEVRIAQRLAHKRLLRISETDVRQVYLTDAGLAR